MNNFTPKNEKEETNEDMDEYEKNYWVFFKEKQLYRLKGELFFQLSWKPYVNKEDLSSFSEEHQNNLKEDFLRKYIK